MHPRIQEISEYLDEQRRAVRDAFDAVPAWHRTESPRPGAWSAVGVIEHLAIVEARLAQALSTAIRAIVADGAPAESDSSPVLPGFHLERLLDRGRRIESSSAVHPTGKSAEEAWAALEVARNAVRFALRAGDGLALGTRTIAHPLLGPISVYHMFGFIGAHEGRHANQLREIAFWFSEHDGPSSARAAAAPPS